MPPPPPPPGPPRPPPAPSGGPKLNSGGPPDRSALLKSIQQGKNLRKAVTNDRSAPQLGGKTANNNNDVNSNNRSNNGSSQNQPAPRLPGIGGLFSEGFPKLKPTGGSSNKGEVPLIFIFVAILG